VSNPKEMLPLHTPRLVLRHFTEADVPAFLAYRADPDVARYQGWENYTLAQATEFIRRQQAQPAGVPGEWLQIAVALKETNALLGDCAFQILATDARQATMGVTFARAHHGRGFASEALTGLLDYLFVQMGLHRVVADPDVENTPSWKLLERLGLRREGCLRQSLWFKGRWADEYLYAILREEWLARRGAFPQGGEVGAN
jgi:RimJ/RimL family protein N-acetyltransferase